MIIKLAGSYKCFVSHRHTHYTFGYECFRVGDSYDAYLLRQYISVVITNLLRL